MDSITKKGETLLRLSQVLLKNKTVPRDFSEAFCAEIKGVLNAYFDTPPEDISIEISPYPDGIKISVEALANRIRSMNFV
ncbi:MAG: hypothetical protein LBN25_00510 [Christensenellaceae bacterium]|jgi:hypothetical protein|nr:hypothetical protein [Christensenellaceae bacterium]